MYFPQHSYPEQLFLSAKHLHYSCTFLKQLSIKTNDVLDQCPPNFWAPGIGSMEGFFCGPKGLCDFMCCLHSVNGALLACPGFQHVVDWCRSRDRGPLYQITGRHISFFMYIYHNCQSILQLFITAGPMEVWCQTFQRINMLTPCTIFQLNFSFLSKVNVKLGKSQSEIHYISIFQFQSEIEVAISRSPCQFRYKVQMDTSQESLFAHINKMPSSLLVNLPYSYILIKCYFLMCLSQLYLKSYFILVQTRS